MDILYIFDNDTDGLKNVFYDGKMMTGRLSEDLYYSEFGYRKEGVRR